MAIGRRSFLAGIGATLAAPFTARALPAPVEWPSTQQQAKFFRVFYHGNPIDSAQWVLDRFVPEVNHWVSIDGQEAETRPPAEASAAT